MGEVRQVLFKGENYKVADWAKWMAQDHSGTIMAYEHEPVKHEQRCWDITKDQQRWHLVKAGWKCPIVDDWESTLLNISEPEK